MPESPEQRRVVTSVSAADGPAVSDRVAVLLGAKGGVGVSSATLAVARELAQQSRGGGVSVLVIDAHPARQDLAILARDQEMPASIAMTTAARLGVRPTLGEGPASLEIVRRLLRAARRWIDHDELWAVIDAGVADHRWGRELMMRASRPLLVTTPDRLTLVNAYATLKRVKLAVPRCGVLLNHCADQEEAAAAHETIGQSCKRFLGSAPTLAGWLPTRAANQLDAKLNAAA